MFERAWDVMTSSELNQLFEEAKLLCALTDKAAAAQTGSYADRNPLLGKMKKCPICKIRERSHQCRAKFKIEFIPKVRK